MYFSSLLQSSIILFWPFRPNDRVVVQFIIGIDGDLEVVAIVKEVRAELDGAMAPLSVTLINCYFSYSYPYLFLNTLIHYGRKN